MAPKPKYLINLTIEEQEKLNELSSKGQISARTMKRIQVLLLSHQHKTIGYIKEALGVSGGMINDTRRKYTEAGLDAALYEKPRPGRPAIYDGKDRAAITGIACSKPPEGYAKWSIRLIADKAVELGVVDSISTGTVFHILKKTKFNRIEKGRGASQN